jgi:hypothetical protein
MSTSVVRALGPPGLEGLLVYRSIDVQNTGALIRAGAGGVWGWHLRNAGAAAVFVKFYDKATTPAPASDSALLVMTIAMPAASAVTVTLPFPVKFTLGIGIAATTGIADNNAAAPAANDVTANVFYH